MHAYGEVSSLVIRLTPQKESELVLFGITRDASVPFFFSGLRVLLVWCLLLVFWALRPATGLVDKEPKPVVRKLITAAIISANVLFLLLLVRWAAAFLAAGLHESARKWLFRAVATSFPRRPGAVS